MSYKVAFVSLGCAKNLVNTEQMMDLCRKAGYEVTGEPEGADVAVLNTCGFIESAKSEAIDNILELARLKDAGKLKKLLVAGCPVSYTHLISSVSHELRTPLTAINGWAETIMNGEVRDAKDVKKGMGIIVSEARRLTLSLIHI